MLSIASHRKSWSTYSILHRTTTKLNPTRVPDREKRNGIFNFTDQQRDREEDTEHGKESREIQS
jgi:hypothetical protein